MQTDFLIIGGGAVGLSSALALLQEGYHITLIERGETGQEASWAGGGIMSPLCSWDYSEAVTSLTQYSMSRFSDVVEMLHTTTGIDPEYQHSGMLLIPPFKEQLATAWCNTHQVELRPVTLNDYAKGLQGNGYFMPDICQIRNPRLLLALRRRVEMLGGIILEGHEARQFEITVDQVTALETSQGKFQADNYVIAAGAWSKTLLGDHALGLDVRPVRGQILLFKFDRLPFWHILFQDGLYFIPRRDGHILVGSTLEEVGFDKSTTTAARDSLLQRVHALFPNWHPPIKHWAGLRPGSKDNIPTIGRHPNLSNLYANCGHFRYGVTMSPACAEILVNEITDRPQPLAIEQYRWL